MALPKQLIDIKKIYLEPAVRGYARGQQILAQHPNAELIEVALSLEDSEPARQRGIGRGLASDQA